MLLGELRQIGQNRTPGQLFSGFMNALIIITAIAHRGFFGHRIDAMRGTDQHRAIRRDIAVFQRAPDFEQFGGDHQVDVSRPRIQRQ
jgi:hypothetical protein